VAPRSSRGAQTLLEQVLRRYGQYQDFQARFVESAASRVSGEDPPEHGTVSFKRPEMWRWEYTAPERKVVVIRGSVATIKVEGDPDVARYDLGASEERSDVGALLGGNESLAKLFKVRYERSGSEEEPWLRLDPVKVADEYDHVLVKVSAKSLTILGVVVVDPGGNSLKFAFSDLRANAGLPASLFELPTRTAPGADPPR
jgi:outer membrane lipoprotein-sorting protein